MPPICFTLHHPSILHGAPLPPGSRPEVLSVATQLKYALLPIPRHEPIVKDHTLLSALDTYVADPLEPPPKLKKVGPTPP